MDSKRKANGAASPENDDRASKRRKLAEEFDLSKGETPESTTAYGLAFLEQIRRTSDKRYGRRVAGYFEKLPPKEGNADYYKQTRMPISLELIEEQLLDGKFKDLAQLESYLKRMISNAKEFYPRSSSVFDDAERVRKAVSNYMTKTNPAYQNRRYQAVPTPLPPEDGGEDDAEGEDAEEDAEGEDEDGDNAEQSEDDEDEDNDEDDADEDEDDVGPRSGKRSIILKRQGPSRPSRGSATAAQETPKRPATNNSDDQYEDVDYKGLSFQQAQEKIVEELLRHQEPEYDSPYFEPFVNLPPRALKDYYKMVSDPLSLRKLQKIVKGVQGRGNPTNVSEFKSWAQFEEKAKLLWANAYFYNEEGSDIYVLAQELEEAFYEQLKQATAVVSEPVQPKIKLKVGQQSDQAPPAKKITLHVGGSRGESVDSPAASAGVDSPAPETNGTAIPTPVDKARGLSASVPSPSPSVQPQPKAEDGRSPSLRPPSVASGQLTPSGPRPPIPTPPSQPITYVPPAPTTPMEQKRFRRTGKGIESALLSRVRLQAFQGSPVENYLTMTVLPHPKEMQQSATINLPYSHHRASLSVLLPEFLQDRQYSLWTLLNKQPMKAVHHPLHNQSPQERFFEALFHTGTNVLETHLVAAIPQHERVVGGPEVELEVFTIFVNVLRN
uniref:Bromo domain-containing protein n=1 Tax=Bionectria ochroleuca TaxID=29856 RepID=A0A0B7K5B8_BIOOC